MPEADGPAPRSKTTGRWSPRRTEAPHQQPAAVDAHPAASQGSIPTAAADPPAAQGDSRTAEADAVAEAGIGKAADVASDQESDIGTAAAADAALGLGDIRAATDDAALGLGDIRAATDDAVLGLGDLRTAAADAAAEFGAAADEVDDAAAGRLGVNRTDLRILGLVGAAGAMTAGVLAEAARLSPAATTAAIQRLVAAGHLRREVDPVDRRRAVVTVTEGTVETLDRVYGPIGDVGRRLLDRYSPAELALITGFLRLGRRMQLEQAERIRMMRE